MQLDTLKARRAELQKAFEEAKARAWRIEGALIEVNALIADGEQEAAAATTIATPDDTETEERP